MLSIAINSIMLSVTFKSIKLSVIFIMPIIIKLIGTLKSIMLNDVRLNVIMLKITQKSTMLSAVIAEWHYGECRGVS